MILQDLKQAGLINPPNFLLNNTHYLTIMGSQAYGCNNQDSDFDIYGFCIPPKQMIFPHLAGEIMGFGTQKNRFENWNQAGMVHNNKEYDLTVFSIINFFNLCMQNNPNMLDTLFTPSNLVVHSTAIGNKVKDNRHLFLHKGLYHRFKGYAYSQLAKFKGKRKNNKTFQELVLFEENHNIPHKTTIEEVEECLNNKIVVGPNIFNLTDDDLIKYYHLMLELQKQSNRLLEVKAQAYDVKFVYHIIRLLNECQQLLETGDLDLQRDSEIYKSIRRGEWTEEKIYKYFEDGEKQLQDLYNKSDLPYYPDEDKIKALLIECLEMHFGDLSSVVITDDKYKLAMESIANICHKMNL